MRITLLDALPRGPVADAVRSELEARELEFTDHRLREERFAPCQGCFECWVEHPGTCKAKDAANTVMRDYIAADMVLWLTDVRFGAWSPVAKVALDKSIGLLSPFFSKVHGETHHFKRYERYPVWGVLAVVDPRTPAEEREAFRPLVERNVLNLHGARPWVGFVETSNGAGSETSVRQAIAEALEDLANPVAAEFPSIVPFPPIDDAVGVPALPDRARHLTVWIGSAKPKGTSASEILSHALLERLTARGWTAEVVHVADTVKLGKSVSPRLVEAWRRADLIVLASPVYVDSLPSLVLEGLHQMAQAKLGDRPRAILPMVHCGFPEVTHTALAFEIIHRAATASQLGWAGHLALGGAGAVQPRPLDEQGGRVYHQTSALDEAAAALDAGRPLDPATTEKYAIGALPAGVYRFVGQVGWLRAAVGHGAAFHLWDQPFEASNADPTKDRIR